MRTSNSRFLIFFKIRIYDDVEDYVPDLSKKSDLKKDLKGKSYFGDKGENEEVFAQAPTQEAANEFIRNINEKYSHKEVF